MAVREGCYGRGKRINHEEDCPSIAVICNTPRCINGGLRGDIGKTEKTNVKESTVR